LKRHLEEKQEIKRTENKMAVLAPYVFWQEFDNDGEPLAGGKVYTYAAGTITNKVTYTDADETAQNTNPITLDASGRANIWLDEGAYKFVITDSNDVLIKEVDDFSGDAAGAIVSYYVSANLNLTAIYDNANIYASSTFTINLLPAATAGDGFQFRVLNTSTGVITIDPNSSETINGASTLTIPANCWALVYCDGENWRAFAIGTMGVQSAASVAITGGTIAGATITGGTINGDDVADFSKVYIGDTKISAQTASHGKWLLCSGSAISRTTYADLFTAIGTSFGAGDGSTTFNLPDPRGQAVGITGAVTRIESGEDADVDTGADTFTIPTNSDKWITGMAVEFVLASGTITGLTTATTYYIIRDGATTVKLASSLANAQDGTAINLTAKSSPVWSLTYTGTTRTAGDQVGEEQHAMSSTELLAHTHTHNASSLATTQDGGSRNFVASGSGGFVTGSTGGNAAMNNMQPTLFYGNLFIYSGVSI
jgi:microcystin-dependent protein